MKTSTSFLVRAWDLIWEHDPNKAIQNNPWNGIAGNLSDYVGEIPVSPSRITIAVEPARSTILELHEKYHSDWFTYPDFVSVTFYFDWDDEIFLRKEAWASGRGLSPQEAEESAARYLANNGNSIAQRLIMLANVAIPGFSNSRFGVNESENGFVEEAGACGSWLDLIYEDSLLYKEKPLIDLPIESAFEWGLNIRGIWTGLPQTNVERSFSYFSHIFYDGFQSHLGGVLWAMGALDAFYCDTSVGLSEKLKKRVPLVLQGLNKPKLTKTLNAIYSDRSRIYHGDVAFTVKFSDPYGELRESDSRMNLFSALPDLFFVVCASLQFSIVKRTRSILFEERVTAA